MTPPCVDGFCNEVQEVLVWISSISSRAGNQVFLKFTIINSLILPFIDLSTQQTFIVPPKFRRYTLNTVETEMNWKKKSYRPCPWWTECWPPKTSCWSLKPVNILLSKKHFEDVIKLKAWDRILNYPGGPNIITRILMNERSLTQKETFEIITLVALKIKERTMKSGM